MNSSRIGLLAISTGNTMKQIRLKGRGDTVSICTPHGEVVVSLDRYGNEDGDVERDCSTSVLISNHSNQPMVARNDVIGYPDKHPAHIVQILCAGDTALIKDSVLTHPPE